MMIYLGGMFTCLLQSYTCTKPFFITHIHRQHKIKRPVIFSGDLHTADTRQKSQLIRNLVFTEQADFLPKLVQGNLHGCCSTERITVGIYVAADRDGSGITYHPGDFFRIPFHRFHRIFPPFRPYPPEFWRYAHHIQYSYR